MFDDVIYPLIQIKFIPWDVIKNLITFGMLDLNNIEWSCRNGVLELKICDKSMLRVHKYNNLYMIEKTNIYDEVNVAKSWFVMCNVWHYRL